MKPTTAYFVAVYTGITVVGIKPAMDPTFNDTSRSAVLDGFSFEGLQGEPRPVDDAVDINANHGLPVLEEVRAVVRYYARVVDHQREVLGVAKASRSASLSVTSQLTNCTLFPRAVGTPRRPSFATPCPPVDAAALLQPAAREGHAQAAAAAGDQREAALAGHPLLVLSCARFLAVAGLGCSVMCSLQECKTLPEAVRAVRNAAGGPFLPLIDATTICEAVKPAPKPCMRRLGWLLVPLRPLAVARCSRGVPSRFCLIGVWLFMKSGCARRRRIGDATLGLLAFAC